VGRERRAASTPTLSSVQEGSQCGPCDESLRRDYSDGIFGGFHERLEDVDLWEFHKHVEKLITDLRSSGYVEDSEKVEFAIRGGATSGEVLGRLSAVLPGVPRRVPEFGKKADDLAAWTKCALPA